MLKWEYQTATDDPLCAGGLSPSSLARMGEQGWELVAVHQVPSGQHGRPVQRLWFKRPKPAESDEE